MALKVNPEDWNLLSAEDQEKTKKVISTFFSDQSIELDPSAPRSFVSPRVETSFCEMLCQTAQAAAVLACCGEPVCTTIALAAGEACKKAC